MVCRPGYDSVQEVGDFSALRLLMTSSIAVNIAGPGLDQRFFIPFPISLCCSATKYYSVIGLTYRTAKQSLTNHRSRAD